MSENSILNTEIRVSFAESIANIQLYAQAMEGLDAHFGDLETRVGALKGQINSLNQSGINGANGNQLAESIRKNLEAAIASKSIALAATGGSTLNISAEASTQLMKKVQTELNKQLSTMVQGIQFKLDPTQAKSTVVLKGNEFEKLNIEISKLVTTQVRNMILALKESGAGIVGTDAMKGLQLDIGKSTAKAIVKSIRDQLLPVITNPKISAEGVTLKFTKADFAPVHTRVKNIISQLLVVDLKDVGTTNSGVVQQKAQKALRQVDTVFNRYINSTVQSLNALDTGGAMLPVKSLSKTLRQHIARDLKVSVETLEKELVNISAKDVSQYQMASQFQKLSKVLSDKVNRGIKGEVDTLIKSMHEMRLVPDDRLSHHLTKQMRRLNAAITQQLRKNIDLQVNTLLGELEGARADSKTTGRQQKYAKAADTVAHNYVNSVGVPQQHQQHQQYAGYKSQNITFGSDRFARRDEALNKFGLQGALVNTIRHIMAGTLVGLPLRELYKAMTQLTTVQKEQLKIFNNLSFKTSNMTTSPDGTLKLDPGKVSNDVSQITPYVKSIASLYAIDYGEMFKVAGIGSRTLGSTDEIRKFMDQVGQVTMIDGESNAAEEVAPGLESVMRQFRLSVSEMDEVVKAFAVTTNTTRATSKDLLDVLTRSGSMFYESGVSPSKAVMMSGVAVQQTGQSASSVGTYYQSMLARLRSEDTINKLQDIGINTYDIDPVSRTKTRRSADAILEQVAASYYDMGDDLKDRLNEALYGKRQLAKGTAIMGDTANSADMSILMDTIKAYENFTPEQFEQIMSRNINADSTSILRAKLSTTTAITSIMEELTPTIVIASNAISNLAEKVTENSSMLATITQFIISALIGKGTIRAARNIYERGGAAGYAKSHETVQSMYGRVPLPIGGLDKGMAGNMENLKDMGKAVSSGILESTDKNKKIMYAASQNPATKSFVNDLNSILGDKSQLAGFKTYLKKFEGDVKSMPDLLAAARQYKTSGFANADTMSMAARHGIANAAAQKLLTEVMGESINPALQKRLAGGLSTQSKFEGAEGGYKTAYNTMSALGTKGMSAFSKHLSEQVTEGGAKPINNITQLNKALDEYVRAQHSASKATRGANPDLYNMRDAMGSIAKEVNGGKLNEGLARTGTTLDRMIPKLRGASTAAAEMAGSVAKMAGQMVLLAGIGEIVKAISYTVTATPEQKEYDKTKSGVEVYNKALRNFAKATSSEGGLMQLIGQSIALEWNGLTDFNGTKVGMGDISKGQTQVINYINSANDKNPQISRNLGSKASDVKVLRGLLATSGMQSSYSNVGRYLDQRAINKAISQGVMDKDGKRMTEQEIYAAVANASGASNRFAEAEREKFVKDYRESVRAQEIQNTLKITEDRARKARENEAIGNLDYSDLSKDSIMNRIKEKDEKIGWKAESDGLRVLLSDYSKHSDKYFNVRKKQLEQQVELYDTELKNFDEALKKLKDRLDAMPDNEKYVVDEDGKIVKNADGTKKLSPKYVRDKNQYDMLKEERGEGMLEVENKMAAAQQALRVEAFQHNLNKIEKTYTAKNEYAQIREARAGANMNRKDPLYNDKLRANATRELKELAEQKAELWALRESGAGGDEDNVIHSKIRAVDLAIATQQQKIKDLAISSIGMYKEKMQMQLDQQDIDYLDFKVDGGFVNEDNPELIAKRITNAKKTVDILNKRIAQLTATQAAEKDPEVWAEYQKEIMSLQKTASQAEISMVEERINAIQAYKREFTRKVDKSSLTTLAKTIRAGHLDENNPETIKDNIAHQNKIIDLAYDEIQVKQAQLKSATKGTDEYKALEDEILDLQRQALQAHQAIVQERLKVIAYVRQQTVDFSTDQDLKYATSKVKSGNIDEGSRQNVNQRLAEAPKRIAHINTQIAQLKKAQVGLKESDGEWIEYQRAIKEYQKESMDIQMGIISDTVASIQSYKKDYDKFLDEVQLKAMARQLRDGKEDSDPTVIKDNIADNNKIIDRIDKELKEKYKEKAKAKKGSSAYEAAEEEIRNLQRQALQAAQGIIDERLKILEHVRQNNTDFTNELDLQYAAKKIKSGILDESAEQNAEMRADHGKKKIGNISEQIATIKQAQKETKKGSAEWLKMQREIQAYQKQALDVQMGIVADTIASIQSYKKEFQRFMDRLDLDEMIKNVRGGHTDDSKPEMIEAKVKQQNQIISRIRDEIKAQERKRAQFSPGQDGYEAAEDEIRALKRQSLQAEQAIQEERMKDLRRNKQKLTDFQDIQDLAYLKKKVDTGITKEDSPVLKALRINQKRDVVKELEKVIETTKKDQGRYAQGSDRWLEYQRAIRDYQKQSLQTQINILEEMRGGPGTFNLPDNVKPMSYYDYVTRNNTHSNYTVQGGDVTVQITLPNVTGQTSKDQMEAIGESIGKGIYNGKVGGLRDQMMGSPYAYGRHNQ